jgi:hypothetical protein
MDDRLRKTAGVLWGWCGFIAGMTITMMCAGG